MFVNENNTNHREDKGHYGSVIKQIAKDGVCPFCPENLTKYHPNPIEERKHWIITNNAYPYSPKKQHVLLISKTHIQHFNQLSEHAWIELGEIIRELDDKLGVDGGTHVMRYGNTKYTGASVSHLHAHIFQSDPDDPSYDSNKGVVMRIG